MNAIIAAALAVEETELERLVDAPTGPLGFGVDWSCVEDADESFSEVLSDGVLGVVQALSRRLSTTRGTLPDDLDYGYDIRGLLNRGVPESTLTEMAGQIRTECLKDDRVDELTVTVVRDSLTRLSVKIVGTLVDSGEAFVATFSVTDENTLTAELLGPNGA